MKLIDRLFDALRCLLALSLCSCVAVLLSADSASSHTPKRSPTNRICCVRHYLALTLSPQNNASVVWAPSVTVGVTSNTEIVNGTSKATATAAASIVGGGTDPNDSVTLDGSALTLNCNPAGSKCNTILSSPPERGHPYAHRHRTARLAAISSSCCSIQQLNIRLQHPAVWFEY